MARGATRWRLNAFLSLMTVALIFPGYSAKYLRVQFIDDDEIVCEVAGEPMTSGEKIINSRLRTVLLSHSRKISTSDNSRISDKDGGVEEREWTAVLDFVDNLGTGRQTSILEEVKNAFLLGASAVVLLAMNADYLRKLQFDQAFTKPVIAISANITRILRALSKSTTVFFVASLYGATTKEGSPSFSKLILWSTCGRTGAMGRFFWEETICMEPEEGKANQDVFWGLYYATFMLLCILLHFTTRRNIGADENDDGSLTGIRCRQLAAQKLMVMPCTKYRYRNRSGAIIRSGSGSRERSDGRTDQQQPEACPICLDDYRLNQTIRVLPCSHRFHSLCVDFWLVDRQTCPLCIVNVFELLSKQ